MKVINHIIPSLLTLAILSSNFAMAQMQIPNADFENWTTLANGAENPTGWGSSNFAVAFGVPQTVFKTTDAVWGNHALLVTTPSDGANIYPGQAELNEEAFTDGGLPYTDRPMTMAAWIKGTIHAGDTAFIKARLTRWNSADELSELIGEAYIELTERDTVYNLQTVSFEYFSSAMPDTLFLAVGFGDHDEVILNANNEFFVDNIVLAGLATSLIEPDVLGGVSIFPNPCSSFFSIKMNEWNGELVKLRLFHPSGGLLAERMIEGSHREILSSFDMSEFMSGIYFMEIWGDNQHGIIKLIKK